MCYFWCPVPVSDSKSGQPGTSTILHTHIVKHIAHRSGKLPAAAGTDNNIIIQFKPRCHRCMTQAESTKMHDCPMLQALSEPPGEHKKYLKISEKPSEDLVLFPAS